MKIIELRDQLFAIDMKVEDEELVPIALNVFSLAWKTLYKVSMHMNTSHISEALGRFCAGRNKAWF
jgi:hypothetical protein